MPRRSDVNCHKGATQGLSLRVCPCVYPYVLYLFLLRNTSLASPLSVFVEVLFCNAKGTGPLSLTAGLVTGIWCFPCCDPASISGWERQPCPKAFRPRPPKIISRLKSTVSDSLCVLFVQNSVVLKSY